MKTELVHALTSTFETHARQTENGVEFWLARDVQKLLGYAKWDNFLNVLAKAKTACEVSGHATTNHFADVGKMVEISYGSVQNFALIRSKGDHALFGKSTQAMKLQWKVPENRPLADFAPTIILKAKDFAAEITIFNTRLHQMDTEAAISQEHSINNAAVRDTLLERGIQPERLSPAEDVKKSSAVCRRRIKKALKKPDALDS